MVPCPNQFVLSLNWVISRRTASRRMGVDPLRSWHATRIAARNAFKKFKKARKTWNDIKIHKSTHPLYQISKTYIFQSETRGSFNNPAHRTSIRSEEGGKTLEKYHSVAPRTSQTSPLDPNLYVVKQLIGGWLSCSCSKQSLSIPASGGPFAVCAWYGAGIHNFQKQFKPIFVTIVGNGKDHITPMH